MAKHTQTIRLIALKGLSLEHLYKFGLRRRISPKNSLQYSEELFFSPVFDFSVSVSSLAKDMNTENIKHLTKN